MKVKAAKMKAKTTTEKSEFILDIKIANYQFDAIKRETFIIFTE